MNKKKKLLSLILSMVMILSLFTVPRSGSNQKGRKSNQIYYYGCEPKESH